MGAINTQMFSEGEEKWYLSYFSKYTRVVRMVA